LVYIGSFIPMTLEQLARENGVRLPDRTEPCVPNSSFPPGPRLSLMSRFAPAGSTEDESGQCVISFWGMDINTASFAMYTFSISVLVQSLLVISISCAADHGNYRKRLLLAFAFAGATATMLFLSITSKVYLLGALLAIIANTCFGASFVLLNSFLPLLVRHHPKVQHLPSRSNSAGSSVAPSQYSGHQTDSDATLVDSTAALLTPPKTYSNNLTSTELQISTRISGTGLGIGYSAGLLLQCVSIVILILMNNTTFSLCLVLFFVGLWWGIFTIPAALWLRPRPGPPLPRHPYALVSSQSRTRTWVGYFVYSWLSLYRTIKLARRLTDIVLFLLAWFLLSDAIATVSGVAILFAKTHLSMSPPELAFISVLATASGIAGAFAWPVLSRRLSFKPVNTILTCIAIFELIPLYGLLAYIPFINSLGFLGLQKSWEMYPLGILYGLVLGGLSSYCRSLYGELIPPGSEAAFYALYAITDKGSSIFGPAIVGIIIDRTGGIRPAFWFLLFLIGIPAPFIWFLNVHRGKEEGVRLAAVIEGFKVHEEQDMPVSAEESADLLAGETEEELNR
jgi:MFS transporter, UMF1 family